MKKSAKTFLGLSFLIGLLSALTICASAAAPSVGESGVYGVSNKPGYKLTPMAPVGAELSSGLAKVQDGNQEVTTTVYQNAVRFSLSYGEADQKKQQLVLLMNDTTLVPTSGNLFYIDQTVSDGKTVNFTVYPKDLVPGETYTVYVSSTDAQGLTEAGSFKYGTVTSVPTYEPGDVNRSGGKPEITDAILVLQWIADGKQPADPEQLALADIIGHNGVGVEDAVAILQAIAEKRSIAI